MGASANKVLVRLSKSCMRSQTVQSTSAANVLSGRMQLVLVWVLVTFCFVGGFQ